MNHTPSTASSDEALWQEARAKARRSAVSLVVATPFEFDGMPPRVGEGSGFVVNLEDRLILTNRHVVGRGPFWAYAIFADHSEQQVHLAYVDPTHDYAFLHYTKAVEAVTALQLRPDLAIVGTDIEIVGNHEGRRLSFYGGTISRVDCNSMSTSDYNTFYIQASSTAAGGASGSPVVNVSGHAVALCKSATSSVSFFLPLDEPAQKLRCLQQKHCIPRGDLQCQWTFETYEECAKRGLTQEVQVEARKHCPDGLLIAHRVSPGGVADGKIRTGDILCKIDGRWCGNFRQLNETLDDRLGETIVVALHRHGVELMPVLEVHNLRSPEKDRFLRVNNATFQEMPDLVAWQHHLPVKGVLVSAWNSCFERDFERNFEPFVLDAINHTNVLTLDAVADILQSVADGARLIVEYHTLSEQARTSSFMTWLDLHWSPTMDMWRSDLTSHRWLRSVIPRIKTDRTQEVQNIVFSACNVPNTIAAGLARCFVMVYCTSIQPIDGIMGHHRFGPGILVDMRRGIVVASRRHVPHDALDVRVVIGNSVTVEASVSFLDTNLHIAIIRFQPDLVEGYLEPLQADECLLKEGDNVLFVGCTSPGIYAAETYATSIQTRRLTDADRLFDDRNIDFISLADLGARECIIGLLVNKSGLVRAFWMKSEAGVHGIHCSRIFALVSALKKQSDLARPRSLGALCDTIRVNEARARGLSEEWVRRLYRRDATHKIVIIHDINRRVPRSSELVLAHGDILLTVNNRPVTQFEVVYQEMAKEVLEIVLHRRGREEMVTVRSETRRSTNSFVYFHGMFLQPPHDALQRKAKEVYSNIYVISSTGGTPAQLAKVPIGSFVTAVDDQPVHDLDDFVRHASGYDIFQWFTITFVSLQGVTVVKPFTTFGFSEVRHFTKSEPGVWRDRFSSARSMLSQAELEECNDVREA